MDEQSPERQLVDNFRSWAEYEISPTNSRWLYSGYHKLERAPEFRELRTDEERTRAMEEHLCEKAGERVEPYIVAINGVASALNGLRGRMITVPDFTYSISEDPLYIGGAHVGYGDFIDLRTVWTHTTPDFTPGPGRIMTPFTRIFNFGVTSAEDTPPPGE